MSERVKEKEGWIYRLRWPHSGAWNSELTVSERVKEKEGWIQAWMTSSGAWDFELVVTERVKEKEVGQGLG